LLKILEGAGAGFARDNAALWPFMYTAGIAGLAISALLLHIAARPYFFKRRPRRPLDDPQGAT